VDTKKLIGAKLDSLWVYLVAPIIGAVIGFVIHRYVIGETDAA
jgi:glycerol uptake facilitator-like aquaporin